MGASQQTGFRHVDLCPLSAKSRDPNVFSVNTLFWKIRVTRVQQKIFHREFSSAQVVRAEPGISLRLRYNYPIDYISKVRYIARSLAH
jgi:hypothetical protein